MTPSPEPIEYLSPERQSTPEMMVDMEEDEDEEERIARYNTIMRLFRNHRNPIPPHLRTPQDNIDRQIMLGRHRVERRRVLANNDRYSPAYYSLLDAQLAERRGNPEMAMRIRYYELQRARIRRERAFMRGLPGVVAGAEGVIQNFMIPLAHIHRMPLAHRNEEANRNEEAHFQLQMERLRNETRREEAIREIHADRTNQRLNREFFASLGEEEAAALRQSIRSGRERHEATVARMRAGLVPAQTEEDNYVALARPTPWSYGGLPVDDSEVTRNMTQQYMDELSPAESRQLHELLYTGRRQHGERTAQFRSGIDTYHERARIQRFNFGDFGSMENVLQTFGLINLS